MGGDRFPGNLVAFPHGLYFGRVEPERAAGLVAAQNDGRVDLEHYRGRSCDPMPAQAADHAVRTRLGLDGIDDVRPVRVQRSGDTTLVTLATAHRISRGGRERPGTARPGRLTGGQLRLTVS